MNTLFDTVLLETQNAIQSNLDSVFTNNIENKSTTVDSVFTVEKHPVSSKFGIIENREGIFVNEKCINIVSDRYEIHQPSEIISRFENFSKKCGLEPNRVITNANNGGLLMSAKCAEIKILNEKHIVNITFYTSHCGKYRTFLSLDALRVACFNQVPMLIKRKERHLISEKHYKNSLNMNLLEKKLGEIPASIAHLTEQAEILQQKKLSFNDFLDMYVSHFKIDKAAKQFDTKVNNLKDTYFSAPGQQHLDNNGWKAYNAITFDNTHNLRDTKYKEETRITKASAQSLEFLEVLLEAAA